MKDLVRDRIEYILRKHFLIGSRVSLALYHKLSYLGLNNMEQAELVWYLEHEFELELEDREVSAIQTVGDAVALITKYLQKTYSIAA
jgi:acyl carrier protein